MKPSVTSKNSTPQPRDSMKRIDSTGNVCGKNAANDAIQSGIDCMGQKIPPNMIVGKNDPIPNMAADTSSAQSDDMNNPNITPAKPKEII